MNAPITISDLLVWPIEACFVCHLRHLSNARIHLAVIQTRWCQQSAKVEVTERRNESIEGSFFNPGWMAKKQQ